MAMSGMSFGLRNQEDGWNLLKVGGILILFPTAQLHTLYDLSRIQSLTVVCKTDDRGTSAKRNLF